MKILFLASDLSSIGGIQNYNIKLINVFKELKNEVDILELKSVSFFSKIRFVALFIFHVFFCRPSFIFCTNINFSPLCYFSKIILGIDYTITIYGIEVKNITNHIFEKALTSAYLIVKLFDSAEEDVKKQLKIKNERFFKIPNSVDTEKFVIRDKNLDLIKKHKLEGNKVIFTICRLSSSERDNKGYSKVIESMPFVLKNIKNAKYILGGDGDDRIFSEELARKLGVYNSIVFAGKIKDEDIVDYYNIADVFVYPSKNEGFPAIVLLEALACGKPIIGGDQRGSDSFNGKYGIIVNPDDIQKLSSSIIKILNKEVDFDIFNQINLRNKVIDEFGFSSYKKCVANFVNVLEKR